MSINNITSTSASSAQQPTPLIPISASGNNTGLSFGDVLDAVNPLQHIPVVSSLYRAATGGHISTASQLAGDTLYGALLPGGAIASFASSALDVAVKQVTGSSISQNVVGALKSTSASAGPVITPLVSNAALAAAETDTIIDPATIGSQFHLSRSTPTSNLQYQRAQAFDAINSRLAKIAI